MKNKNGFTLAETLITLGIIGIVAAMTIPTLINGYKASQLRSQFLEAYSILNQSTRQMIADEISIDCASYGQGIGGLYKVFSKYMVGATDCGSIRYGGKCKAILQAASFYKTLNGKYYLGDSWLDDGTLILQNGMTLTFENPPNHPDNKCYMFIDINGAKGKPNRLGYDVFTFQLLDGKEEIVPMGEPRSAYPNLTKECNYNSNSMANGIACTVKAKDDPDYFKKLLKNIK